MEITCTVNLPEKSGYQVLNGQIYGLFYKLFGCELKLTRLSQCVHT